MIRSDEGLGLATLTGRTGLPPALPVPTVKRTVRSSRAPIITALSERKDTTVSESTSVRRRLVGAALRHHRENVNLTLSDAAAILECDKSKISRIETGHRGIRLRELRELLTEYGTSEEEQDALAPLAGGAGQHGWWDDYTDILSGAFLDCLIIESVASEIVTYQAQQVPVLLQTEDYARAVAGVSPDVPAEWEDRMAQSVLARQRTVLTERQPMVNAVIGEGALRQLVGGLQVMRAQLDRLAHTAAGDPQVTLRVLPFSAEATPALGIGSPTLFRLRDAPAIGVVHQPGLAGGTLNEGSLTVAAYLGALTRVQASALPPAESARFIRSLVRM